MNISSLSENDVDARLRGEGLCWRTGPFVVRLKSTVKGVATGVLSLYADYPLIDRADFADFHVSLAPPRSHRRWLKPQVVFRFDEAAPFAPLPADQAFPMLEWGLNWCVSGHANHYLMIHAAVIEKNGFAAILPAPPGSGKSTLCAALVHRGWRLLSDELTLIDLKSNEIVPLPRPVSLKNASIDIIAQYEPRAVLSPTVRDTIKGTVAHMKAPADSVRRASERAKAAWVIFPKYEREAPLRLQEIPRSQGFMRVADNAFNYSLLGVAGFDCLAGVIETCRCHDLTYSRLDDAAEAFAALEPSGDAAR